MGVSNIIKFRTETKQMLQLLSRFSREIVRDLFQLIKILQYAYRDPNSLTIRLFYFTFSVFIALMSITKWNRLSSVVHLGISFKLPSYSLLCSCIIIFINKTQLYYMIIIRLSRNNNNIIISNAFSKFAHCLYYDI